ncbi:hypothetical protein CR513_40961, partial [Mucuna pruriens]
MKPLRNMLSVGRGSRSSTTSIDNWKCITELLKPSHYWRKSQDGSEEWKDCSTSNNNKHKHAPNSHIQKRKEGETYATILAPNLPNYNHILNYQP